MRRETFVVDRPLTAEALATRLGADPRHETLTLVRHPWATRFAPLRGNLLPGDTVVFYEFDRANEADLFEMNRGFSREFYVEALNPAWPDELRLIETCVPASGARVLEVCCGAGRLAASLVRDGNRVTALDSSSACIAYARTQDRGAIAWLVGDALNLPFPDGAFDVACIFENSLGVLFSHQTRAVEELLRVTRGQAILGLREDGPQGVYTYWSDSGYLEASQTFTPDTAAALLDGLDAAARSRIGSRRHIDGDQRPWGGREFFLVLELAPPGRE